MAADGAECGCVFAVFEAAFEGAVAVPEAGEFPVDAALAGDLGEARAVAGLVFAEALFEIVGVNLSNVQLNPATEQRIAAVAAQEASKAIAAVQLESLDQRKKAELAEAEALVSISKDTGVAIGDLIELRRIRMMSDMPSGTVQPVVSADRKPPSP